MKLLNYWKVLDEKNKESFRITVVHGKSSSVEL
jgi:hypothetical protein